MHTDFICRAVCLLIALTSFAPSARGAESVRLDNGVRVRLTTALGAIDVEVWPDRAPLSACDFLAYVDTGLYADATFYRVVRHDNDRGNPKIQVIQGGLQDESKKRMPIAHESTRLTGLQHVDGALSLARGSVGTASAAAFFVVIGDQPALDFGGKRNADGQGFAVFGRVVRGMDIVHRIHAMRADAPTDEPYLKEQLLRDPVAISNASRISGTTSVCRSRSR